MEYKRTFSLTESIFNTSTGQVFMWPVLIVLKHKRSKKLASRQSHLACVINLQLFMQFGIVVSTHLWVRYSIQLMRLVLRKSPISPRLNNKSVTTLFLKVYAVHIYYHSFTFEQSFRAFGHVHPSYEKDH